MDYDPNHAPPRDQWRALDEAEQLHLVRVYHRQADVDLPNLELHAVLHTIIENQVALGDETPVPDALERLQGEGLTRHQSIHAVASVLMLHLDELMGLTGTEAATDAFDVESYYEDVRSLTKEKWIELTGG